MAALSNQIRVRIAPSPTGPLHVGTARTALFNELFARKWSGAFIVRIEDTDRERSEQKFEKNILEGLQWLGVQWDEGPDIGGPYGPYRQSERAERYHRALQQLLDEGTAYRDSGAIKLRVPSQTVRFTDLVRGTVTTHSDSWGGDFVIARTGDHPLYHLAVVVDDAAMRISHVIRGEDHLSNTARHILLQHALGLSTPAYAHIPLLLDGQRRKLSKRTNEVSLLFYRDYGYLPEAMVNYLALLGWNPNTDREFFSREELRTLFDLSGVQKGGAIFDLIKLNAINKHYLQQLSESQLFEWGKRHYQQRGIEPVILRDPHRSTQALRTELGRMSSYDVGGFELHQALQWHDPDWEPDNPVDLLLWKKGTYAEARDRLQRVHDWLSQRPDTAFTSEALEHDILAWIDTEGLGRGDTLWPLRVALTGRKHSPGPFAVAAALGKETTLKRIKLALKRLGGRRNQQPL